MIGLGFGASEEGGELGFCNVFAGGWRGHLFFFFCCWRSEWGGEIGGGGGMAFDEKEGRTVAGRGLLVRDCEWEYIDDPVFMPLFAFACRFCFQRKLRIWALSRRHVAITLSPLQKTSKSANAFKVLSLWLIKQVLKSAMHAKMFLGGFFIFGHETISQSSDFASILTNLFRLCFVIIPSNKFSKSGSPHHHDYAINNTS